MTNDELLAWLTELESRSIPTTPTGARKLGTNAPVLVHDERLAMSWITELRTALSDLFPPAHQINKSLDEVVSRAAGLLVRDEPINAFRGILGTAIALLKSGRLRSFQEGIRTETVSEVLDQADALKAANALVAAVVLAGGALETHLFHLCRRNSLPWKGDGNIASYDQAISEQRNASGKGVYTALESQNVKAWAAARNEAAHRPTTYSPTHPDAARILAGIRDFIVKTQ